MKKSIFLIYSWKIDFFLKKIDKIDFFFEKNWQNRFFFEKNWKNRFFFEKNWKNLLFLKKNWKNRCFLKKNILLKAEVRCRILKDLGKKRFFVRFFFASEKLFKYNCYVMFWDVSRVNLSCKFWILHRKSEIFICSSIFLRFWSYVKKIMTFWPKIDLKINENCRKSMKIHDFEINRMVVDTKSYFSHAREKIIIFFMCANERSRRVDNI